MDNPVIFLRLSEVGKKLKAVKMSNMQRYKARHIYDVYNMLQPLLAENGIVITRTLINDSSKEVESKNGTKGTHRYQLWEFKFSASDGSHITTQFPSESIDWGDKAASQCDAMAFKQMLIHTFMIPTEDTHDPDNNEEKQVVSTPIPEHQSSPNKSKASSSGYVMQKGKYAGKHLDDIPLEELKSWHEYMFDKGYTKGQDYKKATEYINKLPDDPFDTFLSEEIPF